MILGLAPPARAPRGRADAAGFSLLELLVLVVVLSIVGSAIFTVTVRGSRDAVHGAHRQSARAALQEKLTAEPPADDGGSVVPAAPVEGYYDVVVATPDGAFAPAGERPDGSPVIRRQWRVWTEASGLRHLQVSAELLDASGERPRSDDGAYSVVFERRVRPRL